MLHDERWPCIGPRNESDVSEVPVGVLVGWAERLMKGGVRWGKVWIGF